jgi:hypothetical protein
MKFTELERHLSIPRINRYLTLCGNKTKAAKLYKGNLAIAQAFHPILGVFEVVLRNHLYNAVANYFRDIDWIINQQAGFMSAPPLTRD